MQKKLIAAAVVSALALPTLGLADTANVNIVGDLRVGLQSYKLSEGDSGSGQDYYKEDRVLDHGSRVILSGTEELSPGLKAHFYIDNRLWADNGTGAGFVVASTLTTGGWAAGNVAVGVQSDTLGKFSIGRWDSLYVDLVHVELYRTVPLLPFLGIGPMMQIKDDAAATPSSAAPVSRIANSVWWDSPTWAGITARLGTSTNPSAQEGGGEGTDGSREGAIFGNVKYAGGPIVAGVAFYKVHSEGSDSAVGDAEQVRAYFGWTFPFGLKVGVGVDQSKKRFVDGADMHKRTGVMVPVTYSMGAHNFYATYASMGDTTDENGDKVDDSAAKAFTVGWDMALSKRTFVGAYYSKIDNEASAAYSLFGTGLVTGDTVPDAGEGAAAFTLAYRHVF